MTQLPQLGSALRSWRERLSPAAVGLQTTVPRRAPGLRREELAVLTGVSADYITRLEQGRSTAPSREVLAAFARALKLNDDEQEHLFALADQRPPEQSRMQRDVPSSVRRLVDQLHANPVAVYDAAWTILTWNPMWEALVGTPPPAQGFERNLVWRRFSGRPTRVIHFDEEAFDIQLVADLRRVAGRYPADEMINALVEDLTGRSEAFTRIWNGTAVAAQEHTRKIVEHPRLGRLELDCDVLTTERADLRVVVYSAQANSDAARALHELAGDQSQARAGGHNSARNGHRTRR